MMTFRLIDSLSHDAIFNMALDEAIAHAVLTDEVPITVRFYKWQRPSVSLGAFQKISDINIDYCKANNIPIVRRITGGKAILHDDELTYSICGKNIGIFSKGLFDTYITISNALMYGLSQFGIKTEMNFQKKNPITNQAICFNTPSYAEVTFNGTKLIGSAQKRYKNGFLQHGSIPFTIDKHMHFNVFGHDITGCSCLKDAIAQIDTNVLKKCLISGFENGLQMSHYLDEPTSLEIQKANEIANKRYADAYWTNRF